MSVQIKTILFAFGISILGSHAIAEDRVPASDAEMNRLRTQLREASPEQRAELRQQLQNRVQQMSEQERAQLRETNRIEHQGAGQTQRNGNPFTYGKGEGGEQRARYGQSAGQGAMHQYRQGGGGRGR